LFGFAFLVLPVVPAFAQTDAPAPATAVCLIGDQLGIPEAEMSVQLYTFLCRLLGPTIETDEQCQSVP
jgi:hypothetical protein